MCKQGTTNAEANMSSSAVAFATSPPEKRQYRPRGSCGTFGGRHPPQDEDKLKKFMEERSVHMQKLKDRKRQITNPQQSYRQFVKTQTIFPQETEGAAHERMCRVVAKWQEQQSMQERLPQENKSVL
jgi:hypothetical protein